LKAVFYLGKSEQKVKNILFEFLIVFREESKVSLQKTGLPVESILAFKLHYISHHWISIDASAD